MIFVFVKYCEVARRFGIECTFDIVWVAEIKAKKRLWLKKVLDAVGNKDCCVFGDLETLVGKTKAECHMHGRQCVIKGFDINLTGFSCKTFARINHGIAANSKKTALSSSNDPSTSKETFISSFQINNRFEPMVVVLENTDAIADKPDDPSEVVSFNEKRKNATEGYIVKRDSRQEE